MVFVFGMDVPLIELVFILTIMLFFLFVMLVYLIFGQYKLNQRLNVVVRKENVELRGLNELNDEEKSELKVLRDVKYELDKLLYDEEHHRKIESLLKKKTGKKSKRSITDLDKIKIMANYLGKEIEHNIKQSSPIIRRRTNNKKSKDVVEKTVTTTVIKKVAKSPGSKKKVKKRSYKRRR